MITLEMLGDSLLEVLEGFESVEDIKPHEYDPIAILTLAIQRRERERAASVEAAIDEDAIANFTQAMRDKLRESRDAGRNGWHGRSCTQQHLSDLLHASVKNGDPVDVANYAMFLHQRGETILPKIKS